MGYKKFSDYRIDSNDIEKIKKYLEREEKSRDRFDEEVHRISGIIFLVLAGIFFASFVLAGIINLSFQVIAMSIILSFLSLVVASIFSVLYNHNERRFNKNGY